MSHATSRTGSVELAARARVQAHAGLAHGLEQTLLCLGGDRDADAPYLRVRDDLERRAQLLQQRVIDVIADAQANDSLGYDALDARAAQLAVAAKQGEPVGRTLFQPQRRKGLEQPR